MSRSPEERLPGITRYRLRLTAGEFDDALARFTKPEMRDKLPNFLFLYSTRFQTYDAYDTRDGVSPSAAQVEKALTHVSTLKDKKFPVEPEFEYDIYKKEQHSGVTLKLDVHLGRSAFGGILNPLLYRRSHRELMWARENDEQMRPDSVPQRELNSFIAHLGIAQFTYAVRYPVDNLKKPIRHLRSVLQDKVKAEDLFVVKEEEPRVPLPVHTAPIRSEVLLKGREKYRDPDAEAAQKVALEQLKAALPEAS